VKLIDLKLIFIQIAVRWYFLSKVAVSFWAMYICSTYLHSIYPSTMLNASVIQIRRSWFNEVRGSLFYIFYDFSLQLENCMVEVTCH